MGIVGLGGVLGGWSYDELLEGHYEYHVYWYHTDHLGTPVMMTDQDGEVVWQMRLSPFGEAAVLDEDPDEDGVEVTSNLRFPGQYYDEETGLHYNWNRYYENRAGRYVALDRKTPLIPEIDLHYQYVYVYNIPTLGYDINGAIANYFNPTNYVVNMDCCFLIWAYFPHEYQPPNSDKFNHCLFSCWITKHCGLQSWKMCAAIKEILDVLHGEGFNESEKDWAYNMLGVDCAFDSCGCYDCCERTVYGN